MEFPNYYNILGLDRRATEEQIWLSYHRLVFLEEKKKIAANFRKLFWLRESYQALISQEIKKEYDYAFNRYLFLKNSRALGRKLIVFCSGFFVIVIFQLLIRGPVVPPQINYPSRNIQAILAIR
jgi:DnaJ-class molecular chaperone